MVRFGIDVKVNNKLSELQRGLAVPVQTLAQWLASAIRDRVQREARDPQGRSWSRLGTYRTTGRAQDDQARWWVRPEFPQPPGWLYQVEHGEFAGWAVYESYRRYLELLPPLEQRRRWTRTGAMWDSLRVRMMAPNRAKVTFFGTRPTSPGARRRVSNAQLATLAGRGERASVLQYSEPERQEVAAMAQEMLESSLRGVLLGAAASPVRVRMRGVQGTLRR